MLAMAVRPSQPSAAPNIHAVVGKNDSAVKEAARTPAEKLAPVSLEDLSTEIIDGDSAYADTAAERIYATIAALQTLPFFGGEKLVWLKSASFLADDALGGSNAVTEALDALAELLEAGLPSEVRFLVSAVNVDKRRRFLKVLSKIGQVAVHDGVDNKKSGWEGKAAPLLAQRVAARKLRFESEAEHLFTFRTGGDVRHIENELEKIDLYLGPERRDVTLDDVRQLVSRSRDSVIFELGDAIQRRKLDDALELLAQLLQQKETPIGILLVAIVPTVRNILLMKDLQENHRVRCPENAYHFGHALERLPPETTAHLPRKKDGTVNAFGLGFAAPASGRFTLAELQAGLRACLEANLALVTTGTEPRIVLEQLLVRLLSREAAPAPALLR